MKFSTCHFQAKTKILANFQICINVPLRQIECRLQNGPITKTGVLRVTTLLFWKI